MNVTEHDIEEVEPSWSETLRYRIRITGEDLTVRPHRFDGRFGDVIIWALALQLDGATLVGWMDEMPNPGDPLLIGYEDEPLIDTGLQGSP
jgi:hypothetical protein